MENNLNFNKRKELINVFETYHSRVSEHKMKFFEEEIQVSNVIEWNEFKAEVVELTKYYNASVNELKENKIFLGNKSLIRNIRYLDDLYSAIVAIEEKYNGQIPCSEIPTIMRHIKVLSRYKMADVFFEEIHNESKSDLKHGINVETLQTYDGKYIFVSDNLREKFDKLISIQKECSDNYLKALEFIFGESLNEEDKRAM